MVGNGEPWEVPEQRSSEIEAIFRQVGLTLTSSINLGDARSNRRPAGRQWVKWKEQEFWS